MEQDKCSRCGKNSRLKETEYCSRCLAEVIENRVKRKLSALAAGKVVLACDDRKSLSCSVAAYLIKKIAKPQMPIKGAVKSKAVVTATCADEAATNFLERLTRKAGFSGSRYAHAPCATGTTNILESITEKELELYAGIKRIKYTKAKNRGLKQKIQELQARHPGTIEALAKSSRQLGEL